MATIALIELEDFERDQDRQKGTADLAPAAA